MSQALLEKHIHPMCQVGFPVVPLNPDKSPANGAGGHNKAEMRRFESWPTKAYGVVPKGVWMVVDIDVKNEAKGKEALAALEAEYGDLPHTLIVQTPSGGFHLYFLVPADRSIPKSDGKIGPGIDIRGNLGDGYIVGPGSYVEYKDKAGNWIKGTYDIISGDTPPAPAPDWLITLAESKPQSKVEITSLPRSRVSKPELKQVATQWRKRGDKGRSMHAVMSAILSGLPYAESGTIRNVSRDLAFWLSGALPHMDPQAFADQLLEPCWVKMYERYQPGRIEKDWLRSWETALEQHAARKEQALQERQTLEQSRIADVFGGVRSEPYTDREIQGWADSAGLPVDAFIRSRLIVRQNNSYYLFFAGDYRGPFQRDAAEQARDILSPFGTRVKLDTYNEGTREFDLRPIGKLVQDYGCTVDTVRASMSAEHSHVRCTPDAREFVEAVARMRTDLTADYSKDVDRWIKDLCTDAEPYVLDWLATLGDRAQAAPAPWLLGGPGTGKSLLAKATAALWKTAPTTLKDAMSRFNSSVTKCPIVFGDEKVPTDSKGRPDIEELKTLIANTSHRLERKGIDVNEVEGSIRVILSANNEAMLKLQKDLTAADIAALTDRIIAVAVPDSCPRLPRATAERWLKDLTITRHILWLMENRVVQPGDRFACRPYAETLAAALLAHSPIHAAILEHVAAYVLTGTPPKKFQLGGDTAREHAVRVLPGGEIAVNASLLRDEAEDSAAFTTSKITLTALQDALGALCTSGDEARPRSLTGQGRVSKRYRVLDLGTLRAWVKGSDIPAEDFEAALTERIRDAGDESLAVGLN